MYKAACGQTASAAQAVYFSTKKELLRALDSALTQYVPGGSTVLVKASHGMEFTEIVEMFKNI